MSLRFNNRWYETPQCYFRTTDRKPRNDAAAGSAPWDDLVRLPDPQVFSDGTLLQIIGGHWWVDAPGGWQRANRFPSGPALPEPAGMPDGGLVQVLDGQWCVESTLGVWTPVHSLPGALPVPLARGQRDGAVLMLAKGQWACV